MELRRIGITQGDANGIGVEVLLKVVSNPDIHEVFTPVVFGSAKLLNTVARELGLEHYRYHMANKLSEIKDGVFNVVDVPAAEYARTPGVASPEAGKAAVAALEVAVRALEDGEIDAIVTAPIDKNTAQSDRFHFPGHTEYFAQKFWENGDGALMIMASEHLKISLVTTHMPIEDVARHITRTNVSKAIKLFARSLRRDFGYERPKIGVLSLNPHCGDGGLLGKQEETEILPAIEECRADGILAFGPISADGLFGSGAYTKFDGILAMYHDQGLAPFKAITQGAGINFTAGLSVVRTSPAHGTAYDKAGTGEAAEDSMREAIYSAIDILNAREVFDDSAANPLVIREKKSRDNRRQKGEDTPEAAEEQDVAAE